MHADQDDLAALIQAQSFELVDQLGHVIGQWKPDDPGRVAFNPTASVQMLPDQGTLTRPAALRWSFYDPAQTGGLGIESDQELSLRGPTSANMPAAYDPPNVTLGVVNANSGAPVNSVAISTGKATVAGLPPGSLTMTQTPTVSQVLLTNGNLTQVGAIGTDVLLAPETNTGRVKLGVRPGYVPVSAGLFGLVANTAVTNAPPVALNFNATVSAVAGDILWVGVHMHYTITSGVGWVFFGPRVSGVVIVSELHPVSTAAGTWAQGYVRSPYNIPATGIYTIDCLASTNAAGVAVNYIGGYSYVSIELWGVR